MLQFLGFNRPFLVNPVTWVAVALLVIATSAAVRADRQYTASCAAIAPNIVNVVAIPEYFMQPFDNVTYEYCSGLRLPARVAAVRPVAWLFDALDLGRSRIPPRFAQYWPLTDCSPGGHAHWSGGGTAPYPQKCRQTIGVTQVF